MNEKYVKYAVVILLALFLLRQRRGNPFGIMTELAVGV